MSADDRDRRHRRWAKASKARRDREREHQAVIKGLANQHLIYLALLACGYSDDHLSDRLRYEKAVGELMEAQARRVIADSTEETIRVEWAALKLELHSKVRAA